jgi:curved DNA-binding protein CbpA
MGANGPRAPRPETDARRMKEPTRNPYADLGADVDADRRAIRGSYLEKARRHHPDLGGDVRTMARINEAFELLNDPVRRAAYDAEHATWLRRQDPDAPVWTGAAGPPPGRPSGAVLDFGIFAGWSLGEIARRDPGYLVWLSERKEGRPYLAAIERYLAPMREQPAPTTSSLRRGRR